MQNILYKKFIFLTIKEKGQMKIHSTKGFTLIELMIVVGVIGILAAIAIPAYNGYIQQGKKAVAKGVLSQFPVLIETYRAEHDGYMCPDCYKDGDGDDNTFWYKENNNGTVKTNSIGAIYPDFRPKSSQTTEGEDDPTLYHYKLSIKVENCATGCEETATIEAIPQTYRGAPEDTITKIYE